MNFLLPIGTLWWRELVRFYRQRSRLLGALGTPLVFWLLIGSGIGASFRPPSAPAGINYLEYAYPGTIILIILFTAIFSTISVIEDRKEGFLLSVLVAPVSRSGLALGKILGGATVAFLQGFLFVLLAPLIGISLDLGKVLLLVGILFLIASSLTAFGFAFAWRIESTQGFHAIMNLVLFPMWLLSGAVFPPSGASLWVRWIMKINPLTYGVAAVRHALYRQNSILETEFPSLFYSVVVTVVFGLMAFLVSLALVQQRSARSLG
ncbi:ABC transporter permease [Acidobacteria bacterium AH-259-L09]|nr:ABC transporter permease [Acidobacteria bacterium AH-259-L09]